MNDWIITDEVEPELCELVLGYHGDDIFTLCTRYSDQWVDDDGHKDCTPYAWMSIPEVPEIPEPEPEPEIKHIMKNRERAPKAIEDILTDYEKEMIHNWQNKHRQVCDNPDYGYSLQSFGGIGVATYIYCSTCNEKENVTDYENC